jgi:ADP-ribose pyrophosphatase
MSDAETALAAYNEYREHHPELFVNPPDPAFEVVTDIGQQRAAGAGIMYQDAFSILLRDAVRFRNGVVGPYTRLIPAAGHGGAAVFPLLDSRIVLIKHQRHATRSSHWEIPRGFAQADETPEETAQREIMEELQVTVAELIPLGSVYPDTGASNVQTALYLAHLDGLGEAEAYEGIDDVRLVDRGEFFAMVRASQISDSFTLAAALQALVRGLLE